MNIQKELLALADEQYKNFHRKLIPTVNPQKIIGIRVPVLREFAKKISKAPEAKLFLETLPHTYYEENNLHVFLLQAEKDFDKAIAATEAFLPYIDNWATCDSPLPKTFGKNRERLLPYAEKWLKSGHTYTVRYAIGVFMRLFLDEFFEQRYLQLVADVKSDEYYVNMMCAWYFATAVVKQKEAALPYITQNRLDVRMHNKTIQKCIESYRIDAQTKELLKKLKR